MTRTKDVNSARVISVIETKAVRGEGDEDDPCRVVTQYWDFEGNLLAENDPISNCINSMPAEEELALLGDRKKWLDEMKKSGKL